MSLENGKIALIHYWLLGMRGGEMVVDELCNIFPQIDIFTHAVKPDKIVKNIAQHHITESFIAKMPWGRRCCQNYLPLMPMALKGFDLTGYDLIISSESGPAKGIIKPKNARHICYCHTPMRYLWDMYEEYYNSTGMLGKLAMSMSKNYLRKYDLKSAESVDDFIANSSFVAERIKRIYNRDATVIYPPVDVDFYGESYEERERKYYLSVGQLVPYKRPDLVVKAFEKLPNEELIVVGDGPMRKDLERIATKNIKFCSSLSAIELRELYRGAKGLIFPGIEDFGIVPVEAQAANCPVIAMNVGGTAESVVDKKSGILIAEQNVEVILNAIEELKTIHLEEDFFREHCHRFSKKNFQKHFAEIGELKRYSSLTFC